VGLFFRVPVVGNKKTPREGGGEHPVSRVLSRTTISLDLGLRTSSSDRTRGSAGRLIPPYSVLLQTGFA